MSSSILPNPFLKYGLLNHYSYEMIAFEWLHLELHTTLLASFSACARSRKPLHGSKKSLSGGRGAGVLTSIHSSANSGLLLNTHGVAPNVGRLPPRRKRMTCVALVFSLGNVWGSFITLSPQFFTYPLHVITPVYLLVHFHIAALSLPPTHIYTHTSPA